MTHPSRDAAPTGLRVDWFGRDVLVLALSAVAGLVAACESGQAAAPAPAKIGPAWTTARLSPGHETHLGRGLTCDACHGVGVGHFAMPADGTCDGCHGVKPLHHGPARDSQACTACHVFKGDAAVDPLGLEVDADPARLFFREPTECIDCHQEPQGAHAAVVVHADQACTDCHQPHGEKGLEPKSCLTCHQGVDLRHGGHFRDDRPIYEQCLDCHTPHGPASDVGGACLSCHGQKPPLVANTATFAGGHESCVSCHDGHDLRGAAAGSCEGCHAGHEALAAATTPAHRACTSCHNPHDVQKDAQRSCNGCHADAHTDHPAQKGALTACITCHTPHPARGAPPGPEPCASCHGAMAQDHGHGRKDLACTDCHEPHAFVASVAKPTLCSACHENQHKLAHQNPGHTACANCHQGLPHHPQGGSSDCARCHAAQSHATTKHEACTTCHEPHEGAQTATCGSCHVAEHKSAPPGHAACTSCHEPHSDHPRAPMKACADCHQAQHAHNPHLALPTGCATCHRPHGGRPGQTPPGPSQPPACATCHQQQSLPGLHAASGHTTCTTCHDPHDRAVHRDRASCTSCHTAQVNHQPGAKNCASCHIFSGP